MPLPFTKQMKDFHFKKIGVLQLGLYLGFNCDFNLQ
jgi:hypothetical protein